MAEYKAGDIAKLKETGQRVRILQEKTGKSRVVIIGIPVPGGNPTAKNGTYKGMQCAIDMLEQVISDD